MPPRERPMPPRLDRKTKQEELAKRAARLRRIEEELQNIPAGEYIVADIFAYITQIEDIQEATPSEVIDVSIDLGARMDFDKDFGNIVIIPDEDDTLDDSGENIEEEK